jgi:hypothetical protein
MIDSAAVDLVLGLFFVFLVFSLAVSAANEGITRALEWRSRHLWRSLRRLLDGEGTDVRKDQRPNVAEATDSSQALADRLYAHPLIRQLETRFLPTDRTRLSHLPTTDFSRALLDILAPENPGQTTVANLLTKVRALDDASPLKTPLLAMINEAEGKVAKLREMVGEWFDARMEALSKTYKKHTRWVLVVLGLIVALIFNVDAVGAARRLYQDDALRAAVAGQATEVVSSCEDKSGDELATCLREQAAEADSAIRLPVGWPDPDGIDWLQWVGWLIAGIALGQGAPFWFDLLRRAGQLRR